MTVVNAFTKILPRATIVMTRVTRRLIPFAFMCYARRVHRSCNVGFASAVLQRDLGLSNTQFGYGAGLFFIGVLHFEVPSNLILERVGAPALDCPGS